jgi:hypothetical protein
MQPLTLLLPDAFATNRSPPLTPPPLLLLPSCHHCHRHHHGQQQHLHQHTNGSTNVKRFASPDNFELLYLSTVFEVCDVVRGNLAISKMLALKILDHFCDLHTTG